MTNALRQRLEAGQPAVYDNTNGRPEAMIRDQHRLFQDELPAILAGDGRPYVTVEDRRTKISS
jgi:hypothetical protein